MKLETLYYPAMISAAIIVAGVFSFLAELFISRREETKAKGVK